MRHAVQFHHVPVYRKNMIRIISYPLQTSTESVIREVPKNYHSVCAEHTKLNLVEYPSVLSTLSL